MEVLSQQLIIVSSDPRLFAKVVSHTRDLVEIEYFSGASQRQREQIEYGNFWHAALQPQTRVFYELEPGYWRVGRVRDKYQENDGTFSYEIRFPNNEVLELSERDLFVRCLDSDLNPVEALAAGCAETQYFADRRRKAIQRLVSLRSSSQGLTGLLSAAIEFVPHQVATVKRILQDSSLRYLLADEVGLGKTIEAGAVLRQLLIDGVVQHAVVVVPSTLKEQWSQELRQRFFIDDFLLAEIEICSFHEFDSLELEHTPDILIVDEAHRIFETRIDGLPATNSAAITELAYTVPRLLLLSATPPVGNEPQLHRLLNLLDQQNYPLDNYDGFLDKVAKSQEIGRFLLSFNADSPPFVLQSQAEQISTLFGDDGFLMKSRSLLLKTLEQEQRSDSLVNQMREHIARTYRIHQRLIRARRSDLEDWAMVPRGKPYPASDHIGLHYLTSAFWPEFETVLEDWRLGAESASPSSLVAKSRYRDLLRAAMTSINAITEMVSGWEVTFEGETEYLAAFKTAAVAAANDAAREYQSKVIDILAEWRHKQPRPMKWQLKKKIVVFVEDQASSVSYAVNLAKHFGAANVFHISGGELFDERNRSIQEFSERNDAWILVVDQRGQEGLNLQFAHAMLHIGLPVSVSRLEQRIGRLDRFGRRVPRIEHEVLLPSITGPWQGWYELLLHSFQIFHRSVSDVQFLLAEIEEMIFTQLPEKGVVGMEALGKVIQQSLEKERTRLNEQYALDEMALSSGASELFIKKMEDEEDPEEDFSGEFRPWICDVLGLGELAQIDGSSGSFRYCWNDHVRLPKLPWFQEFSSTLEKPLTWRRAVALKALGKDVRLLRPGGEFVEALERVIRWDDRGIAHATLRIVPGFDDVWLGFRMLWQVEAGFGPDSDPWIRENRRDIWRRCDELLPPQLFEVLTDWTGREFDDEKVASILAEPYGEVYKDVNLGSRPELMAQFIEPSLFRGSIDAAVQESKKIVEHQRSYLDLRETATKDCQTSTESALRMLEQRNAAYSAEHGTNLPTFQEEYESLFLVIDAIENPRFRLDQIGFFVVAGRSL